MWECIYNDCFNKKKLLDGYEGFEKDLIRVTLFAYTTMVAYCALQIFLILCDTNIALPKLSAPVAIAILILGAICAISAVAHCMKRESMQAYRIRERKQLKKILENETYQLCTIEEKKKFLDYIEKEREQLSESFFNKNATAAIASGTIIFFYGNDGHFL